MPAGTKVATPTASPAAGAVAGGTEITLSTATSGATIRYTTDGETPDEESTLYTEPIVINAETTIKAKGYCADLGYDPSELLTAEYTIARVSTPTATPGAGVVESGTSVALACETEGAMIRYTTDGNDPTTESAEYEEAITITEETTIKAKAYKANYTASAILTATYTITS